MNALQVAAIILCGAGLGGITMAVIRLRGAPRPPTWLAAVHGLAAASAVVLLLYVLATHETTGLFKIALGVLVAAALGGSALVLGFHRRQLALPVPLVLGHGLLAAIGLAMLLVAAFSAG